MSPSKGWEMLDRAAGLSMRSLEPEVWVGAAGGPGPHEVDLLRDLAESAEGAAGDVDAARTIARAIADLLPLVEENADLLWSALATVGAADLTVARVAEPHLDARDVLHQAGRAELLADSVWGVFAAEARDARVVGEGPPWRLHGEKAWCSLADTLDAALVTAWLPDDRRALFAIDLTAAEVEVIDDGWVARGLAGVRSPRVRLRGAAAEPVGGPGWYLKRPGFAWGGIGVAAIWYGGAVGVARRLAAQARQRELDQLGAMYLGQVDLALHAARLTLQDAAAGVHAPTPEPAVVAARTRQVVHDATETVLTASAHAMGPAPLVREEQHARRVADLSVYVRQGHAARDRATLGWMLPANPW